MADEFDPEDDDRDGVLFRFWVRAASYPGGWPGRLCTLLDDEAKKAGHQTPASVRRALMTLAQEKGVNLP